MKALSGKFITIEGIEGVGKSTNLEFLATFLREQGEDVLVTREPGGTQIGEEIRDVLLKHRNDEVSIMTELLLMFAARAQHLDTIIKPALKAGKCVISDRFTDASYAYQGAGRGIDVSKIAMLEQVVQEDFRPDIVLLLDASPTIGMGRVNKRGAADRFEKETIEFFSKVRQGYLDQAKAAPDRYLLINAELPLDTVKDTIRKALLELLSQ